MLKRPDFHLLPDLITRRSDDTSRLRNRQAEPSASHATWTTFGHAIRFQVNRNWPKATLRRPATEDVLSIYSVGDAGRSENFENTVRIVVDDSTASFAVRHSAVGVESEGISAHAGDLIPSWEENGTWSISGTFRTSRPNLLPGYSPLFLRDPFAFVQVRKLHTQTSSGGNERHLKPG